MNRGDRESHKLIESAYASHIKNVFYDEIRRIQKLASALYLVTDLLDDLEPLKRHIRAHVADLLKTSHVPYGADKIDISIRLSYMLSYIDTLVSFIEVARVVNTISQMNAQLLLKELMALHMHLYGRHEALAGVESLSTSFDISGFNSEVSLEGHFDDHDDEMWNGADASQDRVSPRQEVKSTSLKKQNVYSTDKRQTSNESVIDAKKERKERIVQIIKDLGEVSIKDIAARVVRISEKTLQRDLQELIAEGLVLKKGQRRWSTYSLV